VRFHKRTAVLASSIALFGLALGSAHGTTEKTVACKLITKLVVVDFDDAKHRRIIDHALATAMTPMMILRTSYLRCSRGNPGDDLILASVNGSRLAIVVRT
jgi:hypothetical protein